MQYSINLGAWNAVFAVPSAVVDKHLKLAGSAQLKALLWLLRHAGEEAGPDQVAEAIGLSKMDTVDALQYWVEAGLLCPTQDGLLPAGTVSAPESVGQTAPASAEPAQRVPAAQTISTAPAAQTAPSSPPTQPQTPSAPIRSAAGPKPDAREVVRRAGECADIAFLLQEAEIRLGRPLSPGETSTLVWLHDFNGLPAGVILMVIEFALSQGKSNMRYIEKVAVNWANEEIDTLEKAEQKLSALHSAQCNWNKLQAALGIPSRTPSAKEEAYVARWLGQWSFSTDVVRLAYDACVDNTGKMHFAYIDKILERWHNANVRTPKDAVAAMQTGKKNTPKPLAAGTPSFDLEQYERMTQAPPALRREG